MHRCAVGSRRWTKTSRQPSSSSPTGRRLAPQAVERVLGEWRTHGGVVAASYDGARGHPLALGRDAWTDIPDDGLHDRPVRLVACDDLGAPGDVDVPEDLELL